jgi:hypothetical protein
MQNNRSIQKELFLGGQTETRWLAALMFTDIVGLMPPGEIWQTRTPGVDIRDDTA